MKRTRSFNHINRSISVKKNEEPNKINNLFVKQKGRILPALNNKKRLKLESQN